MELALELLPLAGGLMCIHLPSHQGGTRINVPSLTQAVLYERTATFPVANGSAVTSPSVRSPPNASSAAGTVEQREKSKMVALRLLSLAERCRVWHMAFRLSFAR